MSLTTSFAHPLGVSSGTSALVPHTFPVALNGRHYALDKEMMREVMRRESTPLMRDQADTSDNPSEQSLNRDGTWRRSLESWHRGAGQRFYDRPESDAYRFRSSKGVNPWEKWELSLLNDTTLRRASANTNLAVVRAGSRLYVADGTALAFTTDGTNFTTVTGTPGVAISSLTTDGFRVYAAVGASGVYVTDTGITTAAQLVTTGVNATAVVGYVKGRLMVANAGALYNVTSMSAAGLPAALWTHNNSAFAWVGFGEGQGYIYAAGYSGDKSVIYKTSVKADGTALDIPVVAGELPDGEVIRSIGSYLGFILLGTDNGIRFAQADSNGNLEIGALIETSATVYAFEGQDRFVWFGWTNYDATSTGLGRLDLTQFNGSAPAYASDLMATTQGAVLSVATLGDRRYFAVSGAGFYEEATTKVASGTIDSGDITYRLSDDKVAMLTHLRHEPLDGAVQVSLSANGGTFSSLGASSTADTTGADLPGQEISGERLEVRLSLTRSSTDATLGPTVTRFTLRARPAPLRGRVFQVPLLLHESVTVAGREHDVNVAEELAAIEDLIDLGSPVTYQQGSESFSVTVDEHHFIPYGLTEDNSAFNGTCIVKLATVRA